MHRFTITINQHLKTKFSKKFIKFCFFLCIFLHVPPNLQQHLQKLKETCWFCRKLRWRGGRSFSLIWAIWEGREVGWWLGWGGVGGGAHTHTHTQKISRFEIIILEVGICYIISCRKKMAEHQHPLWSHMPLTAPSCKINKSNKLGFCKGLPQLCMPSLILPVTLNLIIVKFRIGT